MTLEDFREMVEEEVQDLDLSNLEAESSRSFSLWNRYHFLYLEQQRVLCELEDKLRIVKHKKKTYYMGKADPEEYKREPFGLKLLKSEAADFVEADSEVIDAKKVFQEQERVTDFLKSVATELSKRSYYIQEATKNLLFHAGK